MVKWAVRNCARVVTVSDALREQLIGLGAAPEHVVTLRNGVDLEKFRPLDRPEARAAVGFSGTTLLAVGNLNAVKSHHLIIEAVAGLPDVRLAIIGEGSLRDQLQGLIEKLDIGNRVQILGNQSQEDLVQYYNAADALVLSSRTEGMPNVVLESLACGTPVIAADVGGVRELIGSPDAGVMFRQRTPEAIAAAFHELMAGYPRRDATRAYAETLGWGPTVEGLLGILGETMRASA